MADLDGRRTFTLNPEDKGKTLTLEFDGVYRNSLVWLNGKFLGRHPSGYTSFTYDIVKQANVGGLNTLVVRVDASRFEGWFYEGGGIYRHVWLTKREPIHVARYGTYVTTTVDGTNATVTVQTDLRNNNAPVQGVSLTSTLIGPDNKPVAELTTSGIALDTNKNNTIKQVFTVPSAQLWSPETPRLYRLLSLVKGPGDQVADKLTTPFGIRTVAFDVEKGFMLNGKPYKIYGTCNHQDHAGVGSAMPDALQFWRIAQLKAMGSNAYRTSHNPPTPELLDACDQLGMLVLDETRRAGADKEALGQLESMIKRDKNHPSVFAWSICNEEFRDNVQSDDQIGAPIAKAMQDLAHQLDPSRLCTCAMNGGFGQGFSNVIDVMGFNYPTRGKRPITTDEFHAKFPTKPCLGTEDASTRCSRGIYAEDDQGNISSTAMAKGTITDKALKAKGYVSAYDIEGTSSAEHWVTYYHDRPYMSGSFAWTGFDYRGEPTPYRWPCTTSHFGIMDLCGFPKDNYYYYQAWWTDKPVVHLFPHWNWPGKEGKTIDVWVHSNADEVELSLNGEVIGKQKVTPFKHVEWKVKYAPGKLVVKGFKAGSLIALDQVETTGAPAAIALSVDRTQINDINMIKVSTVDAQGRYVPTAMNLINFSLTGPGKIIGVGNGDPSSHESDKDPKRTLFNGLAQVIVQTNQSGEITLTASGEGLKPVTVSFQAAPASQIPAVP